MRLFTVLAIGVLLSGCATKIRNLTAETWSGNGVYVGYWEGTCKPFLGCDAGDGKVSFCKLDPATNVLACQEQDAIAPLLARKPSQ